MRKPSFSKYGTVLPSHPSSLTAPIRASMGCRAALARLPGAKGRVAAEESVVSAEPEQRAGKLEQSEVVPGLLFPADEDHPQRFTPGSVVPCQPWIGGRAGETGGPHACSTVGRRQLDLGAVRVLHHHHVQPEVRSEVHD